MAIKAFQKNDQEFVEIRVNAKGQGPLRNFEVSRKRIYPRKKFANDKAIQSKENLLLREAYRELEIKISKGQTWDSIINKWAKFHRELPESKKLRDSYINETLDCLYKWTEAWLCLPVVEITSSEVDDVFESMDSYGRAISYQHMVKRRIREIFQWGLRKKLIPQGTECLVDDIKFKKAEEKKPEILQKVDIGKLLSDTRIGKHRWHPIYFMAVYTGMRSGELQALCWPAVDFEADIIYVHENYSANDRRDPETKGFGPTKGRYWRPVPMNEQLKIFLRKLYEKSNGGFIDPEFPEKRFVLPRIKMWKSGHQAEVLKKVCLNSDIRPICFHTLRACFATHLLRLGIRAAQVMVIGGWKDLKTMERYIRLAGTDVKGLTDDLDFSPEQEKKELHLIENEAKVLPFKGFS